MESQFSVVLCNFGGNDEFNQKKISVDTNFFFSPSEKYYNT
jgi:hypothetical protein